MGQFYWSAAYLYLVETVVLKKTDITLNQYSSTRTVKMLVSEFCPCIGIIGLQRFLTVAMFLLSDLILPAKSPSHLLWAQHSSSSKKTQTDEQLTSSNPLETKDIDLHIEMEATPQEVEPGDLIDYTIRYLNRGTETAKNVFITAYGANHSAGVYYTFFVDSSSAPPVDGTVATTGDGRLLNMEWNIGDLSPGMTTPNLITFRVRIDANLTESKALTATAAIRGDRFKPSEVPATVFVKVPRAGPGDVVFTKTTNSTNLCAGNEVEFVIAAANNSDVALDSLLVFDAIPDSALFISSIPEPSFVRNDTLFWWIESIPPRGQQTIRARFRFDTPGEFENIAGGLLDELPIPPAKAMVSISSLPDLIPEFLSCNGTSEANEPVTVDALVRNIGGCPAASFEVAFFVDDRNATPFWTEMVSLNAGEERVLQARWENPADGDHIFYVHADFGDVVQESNEENNIGHLPCKVCLGARPPDPEIAVAPSVIEPQEFVTLSIRVFAPVDSSELMVTFADGSTQIMHIPALTSEEVLEVPFSDTRFRTSASEETILFEIRTVNECGFASMAVASLIIRGSNDYTLAANVFRPLSQDAVEIKFKLSSNREATLNVLDISGRLIKRFPTQMYDAGWNSAFWDGTSNNGAAVGSGVYIVTIDSGTLKQWKKVILVR